MCSGVRLGQRARILGGGVVSVQIVVLVNLECDSCIAAACNPGERFTFSGRDLADAMEAARSAGWRIRRLAVCPPCAAFAGREATP